MKYDTHTQVHAHEQTERDREGQRDRDGDREGNHKPYDTVIKREYQMETTVKFAMKSSARIQCLSACYFLLFIPLFPLLFLLLRLKLRSSFYVGKVQQEIYDSRTSDF